jgi:2-aminoethylphosphonate-pyruvate transaminase
MPTEVNVKQKRPERTILMNPGPVVVDERVREALSWPDMCHREPEFSSLMTRVREKITRVCGGDENYATVLLTGSGTAALEATLSSVVPPDGKVLIMDNGHYGERLVAMAEIHRLPRHVIRHGWAVPFEIQAMEKTLAADPAITHVAMVHHETSTGMLNPLREVGEIVAHHGRSLMVDAVSSLGGELMGVRTDHIDWCVGTANKCLEGIPGLSFVCAPRARLEALAAIAPRSYYLNLFSLYAAEEQTKAPPFTPAVQTMYAFDVALDLMLAEGVAARTARYQGLASQLRDGLEAMGFKLLLPPHYRCSTLTAIYFPEGLDYRTLHDRLRAEGFVIYAGQDTLKQKAFRLANMGQITSDDIGRFLAALKLLVSEFKVQEAISR